MFNASVLVSARGGGIHRGIIMEWSQYITNGGRGAQEDDGTTDTTKICIRLDVMAVVRLPSIPVWLLFPFIRCTLLGAVIWSVVHVCPCIYVALPECLGT